VLKDLINKVMFKHSKVKGLIDIPEDQISISLSKEEIAMILQSIKNANFSGSVLEDLYNLVYKLQTNFNSLNK
tara:strand:- start:598 stop:816 length:219 start_codon:yes stop_codon:yes gene_type:complete